MSQVAKIDPTAKIGNEPTVRTKIAKLHFTGIKLHVL